MQIGEDTSNVLHAALLEELDGKAYGMIENLASASRLLGRTGSGHERLENTGRAFATTAQPSMNTASASIRTTHATLVEMHLSLQRLRDRIVMIPTLANEYTDAAASVQPPETVEEAFQFAEQAEYAEL